ncbi:mannose-1-phosphate guanylyltransferase [Paenibacillus sp. CAA11]|uniref:sugar phosphate nucleotidyltransferase n=1 Tax=Paenibacillus sp. CAA11 TaxID=1532905 RepID=UPI000D3AABEF|nr:sugar phosphate nucleotidyltransferase [Paenibacillus sp. CAA11]AWB44545.1 mannose-1-phosphate guanylyltransferase [Paenibacillus sp. CAA11]
MITLILCGGAGKRLWPLSNEVRSKLFLKLLPTPLGEPESMLQRVTRQLKETGLHPQARLITHTDQVPLVMRHTSGQLPILGEPNKKGTFTAAALAAAYLLTRQEATEEDIVCLAPADMYADNDFFHTMTGFPKLLRDTGAELALLGARPTSPSTQYGYIIAGDGNGKPGEYASVQKFIEKPNQADAAKLIEQQALWNCGVFAFRLRLIVKHMQQLDLPLDYNELLAAYPALPVRSFDETVAEVCKHAIVKVHQGEWSDLGSWEALTRRIDQTVIGSGSVLGSSEGTHLINELPIPIHVIGMTDCIAAASRDGILLAKKSCANEIKKILGGQQLQPMQGETASGSFQVIEEEAGSPIPQSTYRIIKRHLLPEHHTGCLKSKAHKVWTMLSGHGELYLEGQLYQVQRGDTYRILPGAVHALYSAKEISYTETRIGDIQDEDEDYGVELKWNDLLQL